MFASRTNWRLEPNRFALALEAHRRSGKRLLDLTASNPTICGFSYPEQAILAALAVPQALEYHPESRGLLETRAAVSDYYRGRAAFAGSVERVDPERIFITSSTSEAYTYVFRLLCEAGDDILVPTPSYPLLEFLADLADIRQTPYPLLYDHGWQIDLESLAEALTPRSRAVLVVHPNNPTGSFVKPREAAELAAICSRRDMAIIADEVFLDYAAGPPHEPETAPTFALHHAALTFTLSGLSKIAALPQMKLAWLAVSGPEALARQASDRLEVIADTYLSPSTPVQLATPAFLGLRGDLQAQLQRRIAANLAYLDQALGGPCPITRLDREAGWYAVLRAPASGQDDALAVELLERHSVLVHPGHFFNFARDGYLVLSLITPQADFREGVRRLLEFFAA